jgi:hypothetical protein
LADLAETFVKVAGGGIAAKVTMVLGKILFKSIKKLKENEKIAGGGRK